MKHYDGKAEVNVEPGEPYLLDRFIFHEHRHG